VARGIDVNVVRTPGLVRFVAARPSRGVVLARAGWRLRRSGWWYRAPFLPLPDDAYWEFRRVTAFGTTGAPTPADLVDAARWALRQPVGK
jgi:hypothetical protein